MRRGHHRDMIIGRRSDRLAYTLFVVTASILFGCSESEPNTTIYDTGAPADGSAGDTSSSDARPDASSDTPPASEDALVDASTESSLDALGPETTPDAWADTDGAATPGADGADDTTVDGSEVASDAAADLGDQLLGDSGVTVNEVLGYYSGDWGAMVLRQYGGEVWGTYVHDQGTLVLTLQGEALVGWWCEVPSRTPTADAGEVEFRFTRTAAGIALDGRWRYGATGTWREDWDLTRTTSSAPPEALLTRFDTPAAFCRHP